MEANSLLVQVSRPISQAFWDSEFAPISCCWEQVKAASGQLVPQDGDFGNLPPHSLIVKFWAGPLNQMHWVDVSSYPVNYQDIPEDLVLPPLALNEE